MWPAAASLSGAVAGIAILVLLPATVAALSACGGRVPTLHFSHLCVTDFTFQPAALSSAIFQIWLAELTF